MVFLYYRRIDPCICFTSLVAIATELFILPTNQMMVNDQFVLLSFCPEFYEATLSGFGVMSEAMLFSIGILHLYLHSLL